MQLHIIFVTLISTVLAERFPLDLKLCKRSELGPSNDCFKKAVQDALPKMVRGIPQLKVPELSPVLVPSVTIGEGTGVVHVVQKYTNFKIHGLADSIVDDAAFTMSPKGAEILFNVHAPEYRFETDYDMNGRILLLPMVGQGKCNITGTNVKLELRVSADIIEKNGKEYLRVTKSDVKLSPEKVAYKFDNLFNGDKALGDQINGVLNDSWKEVFLDVQRAYEDMLETVFMNYLNSFFSKIALDQLFVE